MTDVDEAAARAAERKAKLEAEAKEAEERRAARQAEAQAKAEAQAAAVREARERARAREEAKAEARAAAKAAEAEKARIKEESKARYRAALEAPSAGDATGKQRLLDAAMRLHREKRSFASLGIREIAREANLNPNTFYRHFESLDDLSIAAVSQIGDRLRPMLHQIQRLASRVDPVTVAALEVSAFYAFVLANPDAFVAGVSEYHGGSPGVRQSIASLLDDVSNEMREDISSLGIFPTISRENLAIACKTIVVHLFHLSQDYIEKPDEREAIIEASERMIVWMFAGAALGPAPNFRP